MTRSSSCSKSWILDTTATSSPLPRAHCAHIPRLAQHSHLSWCALSVTCAIRTRRWTSTSMARMRRRSRRRRRFANCSLQWSGWAQHAREALPQLEAFRTTGRGVSRTLLDELERAVDAVQRAPAQGDSAPFEVLHAEDRPRQRLELAVWHAGKQRLRAIDSLRGPGRLERYLLRLLLRSTVHRRLLLHALRQPAEVLAHHSEAGGGSTATGRAGSRQIKSELRGSHTTQGSICPRGFVRTARAGACK